MELGITERLMLLQVLPTQGNAVTLKIVHDLRQSLSFTEDETREFELTVEGNAVRWNVAKERKAEVPLGPQANAIIVKALNELNAHEKLTENHLLLYDMFCGTGN